MSPQATANDYEIVFDHLHEDSIPDHPSYDMEEQPTVVLIEDMHTHEIISRGHHKSKERNASILNSSALSRDQQIVHPFMKSVEPPSTGRSTIKEPRNCFQSELPKLGNTDSKLFRQSLGVIQNGQQSSAKMKDMHAFNKQISKKTSALKLQQTAVATNGTLYLGQPQHLAASYSGQHSQQLTLNKTQSLVSSQASLHQHQQQH